MREAEIEKIFREGIEEMGGLCYKWVSPGNSGVPDRIVILPQDLVMFVELKTKSGRLSEIQKKQLMEFEKRGVMVEVLFGEEEVRDFLNLLKSERR